MVHNKWVAKVKTTCRNKIPDNMLPDTLVSKKLSGNMLSKILFLHVVFTFATHLLCTIKHAVSM